MPQARRQKPWQPGPAPQLHRNAPWPPTVLSMLARRPGRCRYASVTARLSNRGISRRAGASQSLHARLLRPPRASRVGGRTRVRCAREPPTIAVLRAKTRHSRFFLRVTPCGHWQGSTAAPARPPSRSAEQVPVSRAFAKKIHPQPAPLVTSAPQAALGARREAQRGCAEPSGAVCGSGNGILQAGRPSPRVDGPVRGTRIPPCIDCAALPRIAAATEIAVRDPRLHLSS